jgi:hypothetical protein
MCEITSYAFFRWPIEHWRLITATSCCRRPGRQRTPGEARRLALDVSYGRAAQDAGIAGCFARVYELGPEPEPRNIDGRSYSDLCCLMASSTIPAKKLVEIAVSLSASHSEPVRRGRKR